MFSGVPQRYFLGLYCQTQPRLRQGKDQKGIFLITAFKSENRFTPLQIGVARGSLLWDDSGYYD